MSTTSESVSAVAPGVGERRIVAAVEDLFFLAKIQETARQLGVHLTVAKTEDQILQLVQGEPAPTLIILDLNGSATKPLAVIAQLRKDPA
ncbi:MAG: response regulator, partial [Terriglobales bacterium]